MYWFQREEVEKMKRKNNVKRREGNWGGNKLVN
jgi:hypothetical protein